MFRQGDVLLIPVTRVPKRMRSVEREGGRIVLAWGEVTGHAHAVLEPEAELLESPASGERYLRIRSDGADLRHEEHGTIRVPAGDYRVVIQREYAPGMPEAFREVVD